MVQGSRQGSSRMLTEISSRSWENARRAANKEHQSGRMSRTTQHLTFARHRWVPDLSVSVNHELAFIHPLTFFAVFPVFTGSQKKGGFNNVNRQRQSLRDRRQLPQSAWEIENTKASIHVLLIAKTCSNLCSVHHLLFDNNCIMNWSPFPFNNEQVFVDHYHCQYQVPVLIQVQSINQVQILPHAPFGPIFHLPSQLPTMITIIRNRTTRNPTSWRKATNQISTCLHEWWMNRIRNLPRRVVGSC